MTKLVISLCITAAVILLLGGRVLFCQTRNAGVLGAFERSIEQGKIAQVERPLLDYALANPNDANGLELLARVRASQGRLDEARSLYQRVLVLEPSSVSAKIDAARVSRLLVKDDEARQLLNSIESASLSPADKLKLAAALFSVGDLSKAETLVNELPERMKNSDALPLLAAIYQSSDRRQKVIDLVPLMKSSSAANLDLAVRNAEVLRTAGLGPEAIGILTPHAAKQPANAKVLLLMGELETSAGQLAAAREHLKRAEALDPRSADILSAQARLESAAGNADNAYALMSRARQLSPGSPNVLADLVLLAIRAGKPQAAFDAAKTLVSTQPDNVDFKYLLGAAALQNGNLSVAQENLELFSQQRPNDSRGCLALGLTLAAQTDQIENARKQLSHCVEIDPSNFEAIYQLGLSYKAQGDNQRAIEYMENARTKAPDYFPILRDLGSLYLQSGAEGKARELLERAASLDPQDADTHFQLSRLYNQIGETSLAKQQFDMFQKLKNQKGKPTK